MASQVGTANFIAGIAYLYIDGAPYNVVGDAAYSVSSVTRETKVGIDGVHGFSETPRPGYISATLRDSGSLTVASLSQMTNSTVVLQLANGKSVMARNAWTVEAQEVKAAEATLDVRWESIQVTEI